MHIVDLVPRIVSGSYPEALIGAADYMLDARNIAFIKDAFIFLIITSNDHVSIPKNLRKLLVDIFDLVMSDKNYMLFLFIKSHDKFCALFILIQR